MNPDEFDLCTDAVDVLKNYDAKDTVEDLTLLIEQAREIIEQAIHVHEDGGGKYDVGKFKRSQFYD